MRRLQRESVRSLYIFISERGAPLSVAGYQRMAARARKAAKFPFLIHSHMLRHSTGYKLANVGQDTRSIQAYLGHRSIVSTKRYTALAPDSGQPIGIPVRRTELERKILSLGITELAQSAPPRDCASARVSTSAPIRANFLCCARAASGHAAAAPPSSVMKSRRFTSDVSIPGKSPAMGTHELRLLLVPVQGGKGAHPRQRRAEPVLPAWDEITALAQDSHPYHVGRLLPLPRRCRIDR